MEVSQYRKRYEAELRKAAVALEREQARAEGDSPAARASAITESALALDHGVAPEKVSELLTTLRNADEPLEVRTAALKTLAALDFLGPPFAPFRADYKTALRDVATDQQPELRESALELLAIGKDDYAQKLLVRGLERPDEALVADAQAIQFLSYDDHGAFAPLVRRVFKRSTGTAREEALRFLAADPSSQSLLTRVLKDKSETSNLRRIGASGLQSLDPDAFERAARTIVGDDDDYDEIRATSLAALAHGREARGTPADPKLVETVQRLSETSRSREMRSAIKRFLQSAQQ